MSDYFYDPNKVHTDALDIILEKIMIISRGDCDITDQLIIDTESKDVQLSIILSSLRMLHEDIQTYKEELEAKLEAEHRIELLEQRNQELVQFNYVASHDLQEPLKTISSYTNLLKENYSDKLDQEGSLFLDFIMDSSNRMSSLIYDLLDYSRVGVDSKFTRVDLNVTVEKVLEDLGTIIKEVDPELDIHELPSIICNPIGLRQVFQNLIGNALKFKMQDRRLKITISAKKVGNDYKFLIADNGIGVEEKYKERIFGVFQRLHAKSEYEGTGIGLALCEKVIEMHNGKIWLESTLGEGSNFYFLLPEKIYD